MSETNFKLLKEFFTNHPVAKKSVGPLKKGVEIDIIFQEDNHACHFVKGKDGAEVLQGFGNKPDFTLYMGKNVIPTIVNLKTNDVGMFGIEFFMHMLNKEPDEHVDVKFNIGFLTIMGHGYLSVLALGGATMIKWLATNGLKNPAAIKAAFERLKSKGTS